MKNIGLLILMVLLVFPTACAKKKLHYFNDITPPHIQGETASLETSGYPPLFRPKGKRRTIRPGSQYFKLAIPNAVDMSGRAQDLQKSLADMLYTELFSTGRFNLLDRGELMDLDPEWLTSSLKESISNMTPQENTSRKKGESESERIAETTKAFDSTFKYLDRREKIMERLQSVMQKADGILLVYITSRVGKAKGGHFRLDYRIVSKRTQNKGEIVLFAGSKKVAYQSSTSYEVEYDRKDIQDIAKNIVNIFPHPNDVKNAYVIKRDQESIVMDRGQDQQLIPGMMGYVVYSEDSIRVEDIGKAHHYSYLGEFIISEVFDKTSTGILISPEQIDYEWDVEVGDEVIVK